MKPCSIVLFVLLVPAAAFGDTVSCPGHKVWFCNYHHRCEPQGTPAGNFDRVGCLIGDETPRCQEGCRDLTLELGCSVSAGFEFLTMCYRTGTELAAELSQYMQGGLQSPPVQGFSSSAYGSSSSR